MVEPCRICVTFGSINYYEEKGGHLKFRFMTQAGQYIFFLLFVLAELYLFPSHASSATDKQDVVSQPQQSYVEENNDVLGIGNKFIEVYFSKKNRKIVLSKMSGFDRQVDFLSSIPSELWSLEFRKNRGKSKDKKIISSISVDGVTLSTIKRHENYTILVLKWERASIGGERGAFDVEVNVTLRPQEQFARWRIFIDNRSKSYGLWSVDFPVINLKPIGDNPDSNFLTVGKSRGLLIANPFRGPTQAGHWPGTLNVQFQCLYDKSERGLYLAAHDGGGYQKSFSIVPNRAFGYLHYKVIHRPDNLGYPEESYKMPYNVMIGTFTGDWYTASQIYRRWGVQQQWCKKGTLADRKDMPRWFKEAPVMLKVTSMKGEQQVSSLRKSLLGFLRFIEAETPILWYKWKKYQPSETVYNSRGYPRGNIHDGNYPARQALPGFSDANSEITKAGGHVLAYVCSQIYDQGIGENEPYAIEAKPNTRKEVCGKIDMMVKGTFWGMCFNTPWWQKRMANTAAELVRREKTSGIYFDTFHGGYTQCFDPTHGHTYGGGNHSYFGAKAIASRVRREMKNVDANAVMTGENPSDTAISLLDGFQYKDTISPEGSTVIPLFASIYGDYIVRYGMHLALNSDDFYLKSALLFLEGAMMGRLTVKDNERFANIKSGDQRSERLSFLKLLSDYRRTAIGGKYLSYGHLMQPLGQDQAQTKKLKISYNEPKHHKKNGVVTVDAVQTAVFKGIDGTIGIFAVNVSEQPVTFELQLALDSYTLLPSVSYEVKHIDKNGMQSKVGVFTNKAITHRMSIPGHELLFLSISPLARG